MRMYYKGVMNYAGHAASDAISKLGGLIKQAYDSKTVRTVAGSIALTVAYLQGSAALAADATYANKQAPKQEAKSGQVAPEDLSRLIWGIEGIGTGSKARGYGDFLIPISQGQEGNDLFFANFVPSGNYRLNETGVFLELGYRNASANETVLGINSGLNLDETKHESYPHGTIGAELLGILDGALDLQAAYIWAGRNKQEIRPGEFENPNDGFAVRAPIWMGVKQDVAIVPGYDFRKDAGGNISLLLDGGDTVVEVGYRRVRDEDQVFLTFGKWSLGSNTRLDRNAKTRRLVDPIFRPGASYTREAAPRVAEEIPPLPGNGEGPWGPPPTAPAAAPPVIPFGQ